MSWLPRHVMAAFLGIGLLSAAGCGGGRGAVKGKVSFNGTPLAEGNIGFVPKQNGVGRPVSVPIKDGTYSIPAGGGPFPGEYQVQITSSKKTGKKVGVPGDSGVMTDEVIQFIPDA